SRLSCGKLQELGVAEGSKLTLVPTVEAGLMSQASRPEQSVMQALESLTETQVRGPVLVHRWRPRARCGRLGEGAAVICLAVPSQVALVLGASFGFHLAEGLVALRVAPGAAASPCAGRPRAGTAQTAPAARRAGALRGEVTHSRDRPRVPMRLGTPLGAGAEPCRVLRAQVDCGTRSSSSPGGGPAPTPRSRKPGAVIESFVNHAPGVFSGTFSGTLHPNCQDSSGRPRRDIGTILQILNDLLSATRHYQGMPQSLTQLRCQTQFSSS
ncbi:MIDN protein, partial [Nothocercus nigrocapillus]|nr:MIDN protein [Nothocercus nigrocapillus]